MRGQLVDTFTVLLMCFKASKKPFIYCFRLTTSIFTKGGFYQDEVAAGMKKRNGTGCKYCPQGTYVPPSKAPGKQLSDCILCPEGMDKYVLPKCC